MLSHRWRFWNNRKSTTPNGRRRPLRLELVEDRIAPAVFSVANDDGADFVAAVHASKTTNGSNSRAPEGGGSTADVGVVKTDNRTRVPAGTGTTYTITVTNAGPGTANNVRIVDTFPPAVTSATWTSVATGGATGNTATGTGPINQPLNLPVGSSVVYSVFVSLSATATGNLVNTAMLTLPAGLTDPNMTNNTSTDTDMIVVLPQSVAVGSEPGQPPVVKIYNALTGTVRSQFQAFSPFFGGGVRTALADFTDDGVLDLVVAAGPGGGPHVKVFNGFTGDLLLSFFAYDVGFSGGVYVAAGDVNGDNRPDIITGAGAGGGPHVRVFSGANGQQIAGPLGSYFAYDIGFTGGVHVAAGDLSGDGKAEVITGAGRSGGPHVIAFDGATGNTRFSFFAYSPTFTGGVWVAAADINFNGRADIITGAGEGGPADVKIFDGVSGLRFSQFFAFAAEPIGIGNLGNNAVWNSGARVSVVGDITGDNLADLVFAPGPGRGPTVRFLNSALSIQSGTAQIVRDLTAFDPAFLGGVFVGGG